MNDQPRSNLPLEDEGNIPNQNEETGTVSTQEDAFSIESILRENRTNKQVQEDTDLTEKEPQSEKTDDENLPVSDTEEPEGKKNKRRMSQKKKGCLVAFIWVFVIMLVSALLATGVIVVAVDYMGIGKEIIQGNRDVQIIIEHGASTKEIAAQLKEHGIIMSETMFRIYQKLDKDGGVFQYGCHDFNTRMGYEQIVESLREPAKNEDIEVVISDMSTVDDILNLLEEKEVCTVDALKKEMETGTFNSPLLDASPTDGSVYYRFEGYLMPDTYTFYKNDDPNRVLQKFLNNLESKFTQEMRDKAAERGYTTHQILTMASIIDLEASGYYDEMSKISAVFYNRLTWPEGQRKLQSDPTMKYPYGDGAYNTYNIEGLPPGPTCNPTAAAIQAAVEPEADFDYYFFVTDKNFTFYYNKTNAEHDATIARLKRQGLWAYS